MEVKPSLEPAWNRTDKRDQHPVPRLSSFANLEHGLRKSSTSRCRGPTVFPQRGARPTLRTLAARARARLKSNEDSSIRLFNLGSWQTAGERILRHDRVTVKERRDYEAFELTLPAGCSPRFRVTNASLVDTSTPTYCWCSLDLKIKNDSQRSRDQPSGSGP
jgi:hypothetical protein